MGPTASTVADQRGESPPSSAEEASYLSDFGRAYSEIVKPFPKASCSFADW